MSGRWTVGIGKVLAAMVIAAVEGAWGDAPAPAYAAGEVMLRWSSRLGKATAQDLVAAQLAGRLGSVTVEPLLPLSSTLAKPTGTVGLQRWTRVRYAVQKDAVAVAAACAEIDGVEIAQPNYLHVFTVSVNDSLYPVQWALPAMGWDRLAGTDATGVIVGVVDSGVDYAHPDIAVQIWHNPGEVGGIEGVDDDGNGYVDDLVGWDFSDAPDLPGEGDYLIPDGDPADESGHGTHVAGTIAATTGNRLGISGIAPGARIMALRAGFNLGGSGYLEDDDAAAAIAYAADNGARVINLSWGDSRYSALLRDAVEYADRAGCLLVAAAGNDGEGEVYFPAHLGDPIAVAAAGPDLARLEFSNWGPAVELTAPGSGILSLAPGGAYGERSGTSMAAAHVSGIAALVASRHPEWTSDQIRGALLVSAIDLGSRGWDPYTGAGLVQATALQVADPPVARIERPGWGETLTGNAAVALTVGAVERWELSRGAGESPGEWTLLTSGTADTATTVIASWQTDSLVSGPYQLRLVGRRGDREIEDRVEVRVARTGPEVAAVKVTRALGGSSWTDLVEWRTAMPAAGTVYLTDAAGLERRVPSPPGILGHRVELPHDLPAGNYRVEVQARTGDLSGPRVAAGEVTVSLLHWAWSLISRARGPSGYAMPTPADLNLDGYPEWVVMPDADGRYASPRTYRLGREGMELVHTSPLQFLPWGAWDRDGDGRPELMAVDAGRVRFVESQTLAGYPERVVWEEAQVWGGEDADLDADGRPEAYLRTAQGDLFRVLEATADNRFATVAILANPTRGTNALGTRQVAADLDADGRGEFLAGDVDGDLFAYEAVGDDALRPVWSETDSLAEGDARVIGAGADLDGDGAVEFAVARWHQDPLRVEERGWTVAVYQAVGDNRFVREWALPVIGGEGDGGIAATDLDADGQLELVLALAPDLYVLSAGGPGRYEPRWHTGIRSTQRPLTGDLDGDGRAELAVNTAAGLEIFSLPAPVPGT
ncbi:MAG: S8 family serine peptidase, partial [Candidatus Latescibacterota bacterium]